MSGTQVASEVPTLGGMVERLRAQCVQLATQTARVQEAYGMVAGYSYSRDEPDTPEMPKDHPHMSRLNEAMDDIDRTISQLNSMGAHMEDTF